MTKAFILGAGLGTRLAPLTNFLPKPLIPVANRPLIEFVLDACIDAGIQQIAINISPHPESWNQHFPTASYRGVPLSFFHEPTPLETGGGLKNIESWVDGAPLLVHNGDIHTSLNLSHLIEAHRRNRTQSAALATMALRSAGPDLAVGFDPATRIIKDLSYSFQRTRGTHQFTGIYCLEPEVLEMIPSHQPISIIPTCLQLIDSQQLYGHLADEGHWADLGSQQIYSQFHQHPPTSLERKIHPRIHPSALLSPNSKVDTASWVGAHAIIAPNVNLSRCIVWPHTQLISPGDYHNLIITPKGNLDRYPDPVS